MTSPAESDPSESFSKLLERYSAGDSKARNRFTALVYAELRRIAAAQMRKERQNHTLQPTALVNEVFLRLADQSKIAWQDKAHFLGIAAKLMRRLLVDHARAHIAAKRGGGLRQITLDQALGVAERPTINLLVVDELLNQLADLDSRQAEVVELRFFTDMSLDDIALVLHVSVRTVKRDWSMARAWLKSELGQRR